MPIQIMDIILFAIFIFVMTFLIIIGHPFKGRLHTEEKDALGTPEIGYKKAWVEIDRIDFKNHTVKIYYQGVMGGKYPGRKESENDKFHSYKDFFDAVNHKQRANALLEVIHYGDISYYEKGYVSSGQRVLQIIPIDQSFLGLVKNSLFSYKEGYPIILPLLRVKYNIKDLYGKNWTDQHGNNIVFSPLTETTYKNKTFSAYKPTILNKDKLPA